MASAPQQRPVAHPSAVPAQGGVNAGLSLSTAGRAALTNREGQGGPAGNRDGYYNDSAGNCTFGVGTLAHAGLCTRDELSRHVDHANAQTELDTRVRVAERRVRAGVNTNPLNQNQFDALVSAAYNSGRGINATLNQANAGNSAGVAQHLRLLVMIHHHNAQGHIVGPPVVSNGLVNRRAGEVQQFNTPVGAQDRQ